MLKIEEFKHPQHDLSSKCIADPKRLYLPLAQHTGKPAVLITDLPQVVEQGQVIAQADGVISSPIHAPVAGKIIGVEKYFHPNLKRTPAIILEAQGSEKKFIKIRDISSLSKEDLLIGIKNSGIVGMGGAAFPTHVKLSPPRLVNTLIVNGCECEPYLACDNRLMLEKLEEIFQGIEIVVKIINPSQVIFAVEDNKLEAIAKIEALLAEQKYNLPNPSLKILKTGYPQGSEKQLIYNTVGRRVPPEKLPFEVGCIVQNVATLFAIYEAIYLNKPLIERLVTFSGDALEASCNLWVKLGTPLRYLFEAGYLKFKTEPIKIICGGPMMGIGLDNLDYPIIKATGGFLFLTKDANINEENNCIRCARCVDICPMNLMPLEFAKRVKNNKFDHLSDFNIIDCIECGACSYICPARIPLVQYIRLGKRYGIKPK